MLVLKRFMDWKRRFAWMQVIFGAIFLVSSLIACFWVVNFAVDWQMDLQNNVYEELGDEINENSSIEMKSQLTSDAITRGVLGFENFILLIGLEVIIVILCFMMILQGLINAYYH